MEQINALILQAADSPWLLLVMLLTSIVDGVFPLIPSETVLVAAVASAAATGDPATIAVVGLVAALGAMLGDNLAYLLGRAAGTRRPRWMRGPRISAALARAQRSLQERGAPFLLSARFVPGGRVAVNLSAGILGYPWRRFAGLSVVAGLMWSLYSAGIGTVAGHWLGDQPLLSVLIGIGVAGVIGIVVDRLRAARERRTATPSPVLLPSCAPIPLAAAAAP
ncbi:DedA family protein [Brachybacterium sp. YJGR34]|uniref:DedA family protein n=1 Tax=Brachybacterium sp. YJGR34 TaxID=2059911 RepID=UPI000E0A7C13|nr:DedA family protein [Brachybacterium sp. YJGR34]